MGKKLLLLGLVFVVVGVWTPNVFAFGYVGRPTAELNKGQWSAGFNYSYSTQDLETVRARESSVWQAYTAGGVLDGEGSDPPESWRSASRDFNTQRYLGRVAYGISDCWTVYGQLGGADVKGDFRDFDEEDAAWSEWHGVNFDNDFTWGWGTKITFAKRPKTEWGVALQMNWLDTSLSRKESGSDVEVVEDEEDDGGSYPYTYTESSTVDLDTWDLLIVVGPTVDMGGWRLYGGPFYYYLSGDLDGDWRETDTFEDGSTWISRGSWSQEVEAENNFGGIIGIEADVSKNCHAGVEFASTGDGWGIGAGLTFLCK